MFDVSTDEITGGSLTRALLLLAAPLLVQNLTQVVQSIVDIFWLGRLGPEAVAAVGLVLPLFSVFLILAVLTPFVGTQILVSQRVGADDPREARRVGAHGVSLGLILGVVFAAVAIVAAPTLVRLLGGGAEVAALATIYFTTYALALPLMCVSDAVEAGFTGWGDSRAPLYVTVVTVGVNVVLDPILIFGTGPLPLLGVGIPAMKVQGAALASVLGYASGAALALYFAFGPRNTFSLSLSDFSFDADIVREMADLGVPLTGQRIAKDVVRVVMVGIVATVGGAAALAAFTIGARVASVAFIPASGLGQAAQSIIGQNLGAEKPDRASQATWVGAGLAVVGLTAVGAVQFFAPEAFARLFVPDIGGEALALTVAYLQILALGYWAIGASSLFLAGFNGASQTRTSLLISLAQYWGVRLPVAIVGAYVLGMGPKAAFWAVTLSNVAAALGAGAYYYYSARGGMFDLAAERASGSGSAAD
jgi:putative MATE family efflux protein